jgi:glucose/arabinose dehydrogenase
VKALRQRPHGSPPHRRRRTAAAGLAIAMVAVAALAGCSDSPSPDGSSPHSSGTGIGTGPGSSPAPPAVTVVDRPTGPPAGGVTTIATRLLVPWGIAFFPDGSALVSERDEALLLRVTSTGQVTTLANVTGVTPTAEGGLLGVAVSPHYAQDHRIFAYATTADDNRVLSGTVADFRAGNERAILTGIPRGDIHDGGRLAFGPDGMLYVTTGETGNGALAQDLGSLGGKILRVRADGKVPSDNPFPGSAVWTYGHRNVQGIAWDADGRMWEDEFGSQLWDEINLIVPGQNYGWPAAEGTAELPGMTDPRAVFSTSAASPSGLAFADGSLWMGALQGHTTWRVPVLPGGTLGAPVAVRLTDSRTRTVVLAPDGRLWVTTSDRDGRGTPRPSDDAILAISPRSQF